MRDLQRAALLVEHGCISERRSCLDKVSYPGKRDAAYAAKGIAQRTRRKVTIYACTFCRGWHLTKEKYGESE